MTFKAYLAKRKLEDLLILPFIRAGRMLYKKAATEYDIFFFFPFYHTGGAEKVHAQIVKAAAGKKCIIFFTRKSRDNRFLKDFEAAGCEVVDISGHTDNKLRYDQNLVWRGKISRMINEQAKKPVVFNGQCNFAYKLSPWIRKDIVQVELIHSFNSFSWIRLPFLPFITRTVMISRQRIAEHLQQYERLGVPGHYASRIRFIQNAIELPFTPCSKDFSSPRVLFVGRGTDEKRPALFVEMARRLPQYQFTLAGEMPPEVTRQAPPNLALAGNVSDPAQLDELYCRHHVLVIPSSTEGFPLVLMEAMARGCAVMATPVGDIPYHINETNGYLFSSVDAAQVVDEGVRWLEQLDMEQLKTRSAAAAEYASRNFGIDHFNQEYKAILQP